jgi:dihydroorotate dehydrogenase electron transfer subunit
MPVPLDVDAEVLSATQLSADFSVLTLSAPAIAAAAAPGQFVMVRTSPGTDPLLRRPFSFFELLRDSDGAPSGFSLLIKRVGPGTARLCDARPGDRFPCLGPLGRGFDLRPGLAWMVAGGVGLAPFAMLAEALRRDSTPVTLYYGARTSRDLFYLDWFAARGVRLELATEDGSRGAHGRVTVPLAHALAGTDAGVPVTIYACGPEPMLKAVAALSAAHNRPSQVSTEQIMGCGLGGCYSCVVRVHDGSPHGHFARSCVNGPVFSGDAIAWD